MSLGKNNNSFRQFNMIFEIFHCFYYLLAKMYKAKILKMFLYEVDSFGDCRVKSVEVEHHLKFICG